MLIHRYHMAGLGLICVLAGWAIAQSDPAIQNSKVTAAQAAHVFDTLKSALAGEWEGKSSKGWTESVKYEAIAGGSVLMETSFGAHANETMITMIHPDGEYLMLTHYCIAKNQPRMRLTEISPDGKAFTFSFLDGTNLPTRDKGHMDKCVMTLEGPNSFRGQWTWFEAGKESWMEEIVYTRRSSPSATPAKAAGE